MNLEFFVSGRRLTGKGQMTLAADTAACDTFTIAFDHEWDGLVKVVELKNGDAAAQVIYTGKTPLPKQVCGRGALYLSCHGYRCKGDTVAVVHTIPMVHPVHMTGSAEPSGTTAQPYTPSAFEQMAAIVARAESAAADARSAADHLLSLHQTGQLTGPQGPAGLCATVQVEQLRQGSPARVENIGTDRNAKLRFTLPYGLTEDERQLMKEQILGDVDTALDRILAIQQSLLGGETA